MEKIYTQAKISKIDLDSMLFEIIASRKGDGYRVRTSSMSQIPNIKDPRPEATSQYSYENAMQKLIPKIEDSLLGTTKKLGRIFQDEYGKIMFSVENIIYNNSTISTSLNNPVNIISSIVTEVIKNVMSGIPLDNNIFQISNTVLNSINTTVGTDNIKDNKKFEDVIVEWQQQLHKRTKKDYEDEDYFSPTTLESYSRNLRSYVFPYLEKHPEYNYINSFGENNVDEIFANINCEDTKRVLLITLKLIFEFSKEKSYISINPIANKKLKVSKKTKKKKNNENDYDFIEEDDRPLWINCMLKEISQAYYSYDNCKKTDAPLAFLFTLLHGPRPEETCGVRWIDLDFDDNDYHVQNAYKNNPVYDEVTMKRIGWKPGDGPLKTPESYRHISLDSLIKPLLLQHKKEQKKEFKKLGKKWSENEYVFLNSCGTPFVPKVLSRNFNKFIDRNSLPHINLYGLRHSFATHCRNSGMKSDILALLMGHTEYETTQRYYIHISSKQKKDELKKVQQQDIQNYLGEQNKALIHLQNNINQYNKDISNLQEIQKEDMLHYLQINDDALILLKNFMSMVNEKEKIVA